MEIVQPIRNKNNINEMKIELKKRGTRDYLLFVTGINTRIKNIRHYQIKSIRCIKRR